MVPWTNLDPSDGSQTIIGNTTFQRNGAYLRGSALQSQGGPVEQARNLYTTVYCPTARLPYSTLNSIGTFAPRFNRTCRTSTDVYFVGYKESISAVTTSRTPWEWRRICFTCKGYAERFRTARAHQDGSGPADNSIGALITSGPVRLITQLEVSTSIPGNISDLYTLIFDGVYAIDYADIFTAKLNKELITVKYDKTRIIQGTSDAYHIHKFKMWHPMKARFTYADTESGGTMVPSYYHSPGRSGMGDYVIVDLFRTAGGAGETDNLIFTPAATLYWHEK